MATLVHPFQIAGLGLPPFRCVGNYEAKFQACQGAPIQPGASCDYCGHGIMDVYVLEGSDGKRFKVGCDCVRKVSSKGDKVYTEVEKLVRTKQRQRTQAREDALVDQGQALLAVPSFRELLHSKPHPHAWRAEKGETLLHYVDWMFQNAGVSGKVKMTRTMLKLKETTDGK